MARYLFIVSRQQPVLYEELRERFSGDVNVEVILDRRCGSRRQYAIPVGSERRTRHRRARPEIDVELQAHSHAIVNIPSVAATAITQEQVRGWVEAGPSQLGAIRETLRSLQREVEATRRGNERLRDRAEAAERRGDQLSEDLSRLGADADRSRKEREEISAILASVVGILDEVLSRLRGQTT